MSIFNPNSCKMKLCVCLTVENPCETQTCDYMCVLAKNSTACICRDGKPITPDSTCTGSPTHKEMKTSTKRINISRSRNQGGIYSITIVTLLIIVLSLCIYYYYQKNKLKLKTSDDLLKYVQIYSIEFRTYVYLLYYSYKNYTTMAWYDVIIFSSIRFHNPSYDRRDEVAVTLNTVIPNVSPGQHEYSNPIDDNLLKVKIKQQTYYI